MYAKYRKIGHKTDQIKGEVDNASNIVIKGLSHRSWDYIDASDEETLETKRTELKTELLEPRYIEEEWR